MTPLLTALGILAAFGALFWLDRYYKNTGAGNGGMGCGAPRRDTRDSESDTDKV